MLSNFIINNLIFIYILAFSGIFLLLEFISQIEKNNTKKIIIIIISSLLIIWLDFYSYLLLVTISTLLFFLIKIELNVKSTLYIIVIASIGTLIVIKDYGVFFEITDPYVPLGISYYFFRLISLLIDYSNNKKIFNKISLVDYYTYVFFFPIFLAGPIQRFRDFIELEDSYSRKTKPIFYRTLILSIVAKIFIVDAFLFTVVYNKILPSMQSIGYQSTMSTLSMFGILAFLHAYLDLMLYTEISKSLSRIMGFGIQENFNKPLLATNISQFWQRWHMSLSNWTRDYVFFPVLIKTRNSWLATYLSMLTIGIWHSATSNWIVWAVAHGTAINFYGAFRKTILYSTINKNKVTKRLAGMAGNILTIYFVSMIFIFVAMSDSLLVLKLYIGAIKSFFML